MTKALLGLLLGVFVLEQVLAVAPTRGLLAPDTRTLLSLGALNPDLVANGESHRLFTAALLHGDLAHLALNGFALWLAGTVLEALVGGLWLPGLFLVGALGGSLLSLALNPPGMVSVGASGAIMGLLAAAFVLSFRLVRGPGRSHLQGLLARVLLPSILPILVVRTGSGIDFAGHLGGAVAGAVAGAAMLGLWPRARARPRPVVGAALAVLAAGVFGAAAVRAAVLRPAHATAVQLIPQEEVPTNDEQVRERAEELTRRYPRDPRSHFFRGYQLLHEDRPPDAEQALRRALAEPSVLHVHFKPELEHAIRGLLARALLAQKRPDAAREAVRPVCKAGPDKGPPPEIAELGLCPLPRP